MKEGLRAKWSRTHQCWYIALQRDHFEQLKQLIPPDVRLETNELNQYLQERKKHTPLTSKPQPHAQPPKPISANAATAHPLRGGSEAIHPVNKHVLPLMEQQLKLKAMSASTIRTYLNEMTQLLIAINKVCADDLKAEDLKRYLLYCYEKLKLKENTLHSRINAMKFYYERVLKREKFFWDIPRPKKPLQLPKLLNETEITKLFNALSNKKHKAMLFTIYSAGLRVSELVNLKIVNVDSERMQLLIERAKGKKDRYVNLSPVLLDILRSYIKHYSPKPKIYLFESEQTGAAYPTRTVQQIFTNAKNKAGIRKEVGIHSLRHSFATHLLEKGTDIKYIKEILGHFNIKTTERYLHVARKKLANIVSPFDDLWQKDGIEW